MVVAWKPRRSPKSCSRHSTRTVKPGRVRCAKTLHITDAELAHGEVFTDRDADSALKTHLAIVPELIVYEAWQRGWLAR